MHLVPIESRILRLATRADFVSRRNGRVVSMRDGRGVLVRDVHGPRGRCTRRNCIQCAIKLLEQNGLLIYSPASHPEEEYPGPVGNPRGPVIVWQPPIGPFPIDPPIYPPTVRHPIQERLNHFAWQLYHEVDLYQQLTFDLNGRPMERLNVFGT